MFLLKHGRVQDTLPTINFDPDVKFKVNISLCGCASHASVGRRGWPALGEELVDGSKAGCLLARAAPAQAQWGVSVSMTCTSTDGKRHP